MDSPLDTYDGLWEENPMQPGQLVMVMNHDGKLLKRMVVERIGGVVLICKEEEYSLARQSRSLPWCVGFRKEHVYPAETHSSKAIAVQGR